MAVEYSVEVCKTLEEQFLAAALHRPMRISCYDPGTELVYDVTAVGSADTARLRLVIEKFVGGGYAGQVYKVKILNTEGSSIEGIEAGGTCAMKILVPPADFARIFRNALYWLGFQGAFALQVNPVAVKAGALWQKFIRRAAKIRFGDETKVVDVYATFVDQKLGSCGELSEWIDGRTWQMEVDENLDSLKLWCRARAVDPQRLGSPEYRAKRRFMADFVKLLHDIGAHEFARQYYWWTYKSQPNCLKRKDTDADPSAGLVAVDFRAGLALLPFLPMSPGDFKLIIDGLVRGSLVQFDRGDINKLQQFVDAYSDDFADMRQMLDELKAAERLYRNSLVDITHNHIRLLYSGQLWSAIFDSVVTGWKVRDFVDEASERTLRASKFLTFIFCLIGAIPFLGRLLRRLWARPDWRRHYLKLLTSWDYFKQAVRTKIVEKVIVWHRAGRVSAQRAIKLADQPWRFFCHLPFLILFFPGLHRFFTDLEFFKDKLHYIFVRPLKLYFAAELRRQWLCDMVGEGRKKHILTDQDADTILSQLDEPYIQRYLLSLVVHLLTLPVTQIVSVIVAWIYWRRTGDELGAGGILVLFQVIPISPGSICRGLYTVGIAIYDRSFRDYNIAVFLSFIKYIGYLAFPIQMTYHYPAMSRFMAAHWATEAVHIVPVFGERGALLEHWVFRLFYNWPLTIRRRMRRRAEIRALIKPRYWHVGLYIPAAVIILGFADFAHLLSAGQLPSMGSIWWLLLLAPVPILCGAAVTLGCAGAPLWKRIVSAAGSGAVVGLLYTAVSAALAGPDTPAPGQIAAVCLWRLFVFAAFAAVGAIFTELKLPDPDLA
jgi:hypothetical protein